MDNLAHAVQGLACCAAWLDPGSGRRAHIHRPGRWSWSVCMMGPRSLTHNACQPCKKVRRWPSHFAWEPGHRMEGQLTARP